RNAGSNRCYEEDRHTTALRWELAGAHRGQGGAQDRNRRRPSHRVGEDRIRLLAQQQHVGPVRRADSPACPGGARDPASSAPPEGSDGGIVKAVPVSRLRVALSGAPSASRFDTADMSRRAIQAAVPLALVV